MPRLSFEPRRFLRSLLDEAVAAARPDRCLPPALTDLPAPPQGQTIVIAVGKAAAAMARVLTTYWPDRPLTGLALTRYGHALPCRGIEVVEAAHPLPDKAGVAAAHRILEIASRAGPDDLVFCLMSGGASALLTAPAPGLTLADKQETTQALLAAGADIGEINTVRKHLSAIKGGRLAQAIAPARLITLAISDVVGDDPATIGSGPTVADPTTLADARTVIDEYGLSVPDSVPCALADPANESIKPGAPAFANTTYRIIARPLDSLKAAAEVATRSGIAVTILGDDLTGEARALGRIHADLACRLQDEGNDRPTLLLSGGEATVTLTGAGKGGPNTEYLLAMAQALSGRGDIWALAADTDGADGSEGNAGAVITPDTLTRAKAAGLLPAPLLVNNDAWSFFDVLGDLVVTGPTQTNVNDFRAILIA